MRKYLNKITILYSEETKYIEIRRVKNAKITRQGIGQILSKRSRLDPSLIQPGFD